MSCCAMRISARVSPPRSSFAFAIWSFIADMRARRWLFARRWTSRSRESRLRRSPIPPISGNLGKAWGVAQLLRRRGVDLAIVENHLPAAAFIALTSGARVILHTHAYVKAPSGALDGAFRSQEMRRLSGFAFVSEYALGQFRADFPGLRAASARGAQRARHAGLVSDETQGPLDPLRGPGPPAQGPHRGDGGDHAGSVFASRLERPLHGVRPGGRRPGAGDCRRASRRRRAFQRPDQGRRERSLCRGQSGVGARRGRNGADDRSRTVRPNGARSAWRAAPRSSPRGGEAWRRFVVRAR